jgi:hypothetical protein
VADRNGMLATTMVTDWVLDHLDELDPEAELLSVPAVQSPCGSRLASVTRLPVMSGMTDTELETATCRATQASVIQMWASGPARPDGVRPGSGCR